LIVRTPKKDGCVVNGDVKNNLSFVRSVVGDLLESGFEALLIGGWAEELQGMDGPRNHGDVDVVLLGPVPEELDSFVASRNEVTEKRLSQKRAYLVNAVLVELFIARYQQARYETLWWGSLRWRWPADMAPTMIAGVPVASKAVLLAFRQSHPEIIAARPW
jgi:hypothetical protein